MHLNHGEQVKEIEAATADAATRLGTSMFEFHAWPQRWPNSGCGRPRGSLVMQSFWWAQTVIASGASDEVLVYHAGRFAYAVKQPTDSFWEAGGKRELPGERDWPTVGHKFDSTMSAPPLPKAPAEARSTQRRKKTAKAVRS